MDALLFRPLFFMQPLFADPLYEKRAPYSRGWGAAEAAIMTVLLPNLTIYLICFQSEYDKTGSID